MKVGNEAGKFLEDKVNEYYEYWFNNSRTKSIDEILRSEITSKNSGDHYTWNKDICTFYFCKKWGEDPHAIWLFRNDGGVRVSNIIYIYKDEEEEVRNDRENLWI